MIQLCKVCGGGPQRRSEIPKEEQIQIGMKFLLMILNQGARPQRIILDDAVVRVGIARGEDGKDHAEIERLVSAKKHDIAFMQIFTGDHWLRFGLCRSCKTPIELDGVLKEKPGVLILPGDIGSNRE